MRDLLPEINRYTFDSNEQEIRELSHFSHFNYPNDKWDSCSVNGLYQTINLLQRALVWIRICCFSWSVKKNSLKPRKLYKLGSWTLKSRTFPRGLTLCKMSVFDTNSRIQLAVILIWSTIRHFSLNAHKIQCMNGSFFDFLYVQWFISGQRLEKFVYIIIPLTYEYLRPVLIVNLNVGRSNFFEDASHIRSLYMRTTWCR